MTPVSSSNSLLAVSSKSSLGSASPLGIVQAPSSLFWKKGPPGWASSTCNLPSWSRYISNPALTRGIDLNLITTGKSALILRLPDSRQHGYREERVLSAPDGWVLLPPGDASLIRRVQEAGEH